MSLSRNRLPAVILDTSSLISLALMQQRADNSPPNASNLQNLHSGVDAAIEALVLYDELLVDGPSVSRNRLRLPEIQPFVSMCRTIATNEGDEEQIYRDVLRNCIDHITGGNNLLAELFEYPVEEFMAAEMGVAPYYPSAQWQDVEDHLGGEAAKLAAAISVKSAGTSRASGAACLLLLRTLYYNQLQQTNNSDLILHPMKAAYYEDDSELRTGNTILNLFDEKVRKSFYERKMQWFGRPDLSFQIPMLTSYVINRCSMWRDLPKVIEEVRNSNEAKAFRTGLAAFIGAVESHDNQKVDAIVSELTTASEGWSHSINRKGLTKAVKVTIPFTQASTEFNLPDKKIGKSSSGEKMLVFLHTIVSGS